MRRCLVELVELGVKPILLITRTNTPPPPPPPPQTLLLRRVPHAGGYKRVATLMDTLYDQLVRLFSVVEDDCEPGEFPDKTNCGILFAEVATVCLSLCKPVLVPSTTKGDDKRAKELPTTRDAFGTAHEGTNLLVTRFLLHTGLHAYTPLPVGNVQLHQFLVLVDPSITNPNPEAFKTIVESFQWPVEQLRKLLTHVLVHPLPALPSDKKDNPDTRRNWSDTHLIPTLVAQLGPRIVSDAPEAHDILAIDAYEPAMESWARAPRTATRFHSRRLRETSFGGYLAWAIVQSPEAGRRRPCSKPLSGPFDPDATRTTWKS